jgi:putative ABC transport system substrate-binding protein
MRRREFVSTLSGAAVCPVAARAQQPARIHQIGYLGLTTFAAQAGFGFIGALKDGFRRHGYLEGTNVAFHWRFAEGIYQRLAALAGELVKLNVDVIMTHGTPGALAAKAATATIPIVVITAADLVASGIVASLARPGANLTGQNVFAVEIALKRLELIKEAVPAAKRVAVLINRGNRYSERALAAMQSMAQGLRVELLPVDLRAPHEFDHAFAALAAKEVHALALIDDPFLIAQAKHILRLASEHRIPMIAGPEFDPKAGLLIAHGVDYRELWFRSASFVDKILKGASPADLPIEQATKFRLIINLKRAEILGLVIPRTVLARADEVIE